MSTSAMSQGASTTEERSARDVLAWSRELVEPALREAIDALPASMRRIAGYHLGWWDADGAPDHGDGGKALRPALVLLAAEAVGGSSADAVPAAVAVELVHNFSLLHDDVMDGDATRRHRATAWTVYGVGPAILAGDALVTLAFDVLAATGHPVAQGAMRMLSTAVLDLVDGQSADMGFEDRSDVGIGECVSMADGKTGALLGCACALGASFAGADAEKVARMRNFGSRLGLAFQHVDDLLGIWGEPAVTGKPVYSDLSNRKKSLPVVAALTSRTAAAEELGVLYRRADALTETELARAAELIDLAGGRAWSQAQADELLKGALGEMAMVEPSPRAALELGLIARLVTRRDH
ncbi:family 2 encapsulin nanocompartment cargo protein polyprenyl transferase [Phytomonospora sp. NPDC050363]|uniref:family 2 encapsulin nanocompartment cargo protein polyprenyl transferase n=1 Tax=Phytomonospora sp. NPDC050363 TaxID=3155642 RepID=UPI003410E83F